MSARFTILAEPTATLGRVSAPGIDATVTLGRAGMIDAQVKQEGDGATPIGSWGLVYVFYRPDREKKPITGLPTVALNPAMLWCDDVDHPHYNTLVDGPFSPSHERLWRDDHRYDLIVTLDHNTNPVVPGQGSAIVLHLMAKEQTPTEGCIGFNRTTLLSFLKLARPGDRIRFGIV